jgi:hypothetical protein
MCDLTCWAGVFYDGLILFNIAMVMTCLGVLFAAWIFYGGGGPPDF